MNKLLLKALLFLMLAAIPMQGFCFPVIPEHHWILNSLDGFWEEPQYTTGNSCIQVINTAARLDIYGISRDYIVQISGLTDPRTDPPNHDYIMCEVRRGEDQQRTTDIERYPLNDVYSFDNLVLEDEVIFCNFPEEGRLIVWLTWQINGRDFSRTIKYARCYWQTQEMMEASLN